MRTLIVDDERHARAEIRYMLSTHSHVNVVGEAENSDQALEMIRRLEPQLLFLDIQLQGDTGFDLLARLTAPQPKIIFTTAYSEFALRAFQVNALDYLVKPVKAALLNEALLRAMATCQPSTADPGDTEHPQGTDTAQLKLTADDRVFIRDDTSCWFLPIRDIVLLEAEGNYTRVHCSRAKPLISKTLNALEERLPESLFFRANRSQIINLTCIEAMENWFSGNLKARLNGGLEVEISRRQATLFRQRKSL
ncbi:DNA-binding response regulator [Verrucomicrobia bacterium LW23]|nr:DNA-binding response regulator [Verrucomicrobia bacterium LW23]